MREEVLPPGWAHATIGELFVFRGGGTPDKTQASYWNGEIPWASVKDIKSPQLHGTKDAITQDGLKNSAASIAEIDDVILVTRISPGETAVSKIRCAINQDLKIVRPPPGMAASFIRLLFRHLQPKIVSLSSGTTVLGIRLNELSSINLPLPPLAEQKRIVAKIEELFSELEAGEESLRLARRQLATYRQSLLKQAFEGKLTRCRKVELIPLRNLITGLSQGWSPKCELNRAPRVDEWAIIKTTAIQHCRYDDWEAKPLPPPFEPRPSIEIKDGDFLMTRKGPRTRAGVSCYVRKTRPLLMVCDTVYRFRCIEAKVHPLYLELALNSPDVLRAIDRQKAGISESGLSLTHTKMGIVEIPICSLPEQQEIVCLLDKQFEVIERTEREIDAALQRSEALRQAILKKAFTGRLVAQNPADEPATELLARLQEERAGSAGIVRKKTRP